MSEYPVSDRLIHIVSSLLAEGIPLGTLRIVRHHGCRWLIGTRAHRGYPMPIYAGLELKDGRLMEHDARSAPAWIRGLCS